MDRCGCDSGGLELVVVGPPEVEMRTASGGSNEPSADCCRVVTRVAERIDHFFAHFTAAVSERRADRGHEILRAGRVLGSQRLDRGQRDPLHGAAPAGVDRRDDAEPAVGDQDRRAVGDAYDERDRGVVADDRIRLRRGVAATGAHHRTAVDLVEQPEPLRRDAGESGERGPFLLVVPERQRGGGEEMPDGIERRAAKDLSPRRLRPRESVARLGSTHGHHRAGYRRH